MGDTAFFFRAKCPDIFFSRVTGGIFVAQYGNAFACSNGLSRGQYVKWWNIHLPENRGASSQICLINRDVLINFQLKQQNRLRNQ